MALSDSQTKFYTALGYLIFAIIIFGSLGVTIPLFLENQFTLKNFNQNLATYALPLFATGGLELMMMIAGMDSNYRRLYITISYPVLLGLLFLAGYLIYLNFKEATVWATLYFLIILIVAYILWWRIHSDDESFGPSSTLGGNPNKQLSNG